MKKQEVEGFKIGAHSTPDIDVLLQIKEGINNIKEHHIQTNFIRKKVKDNKDQVDDPKIVLWKLRNSLQRQCMRQPLWRTISRIITHPIKSSCTGNQHNCTEVFIEKP